MARPEPEPLFDCVSLVSLGTSSTSPSPSGGCWNKNKFSVEFYIKEIKIVKSNENDINFWQTYKYPKMSTAITLWVGSRGSVSGVYAAYWIHLLSFNGFRWRYFQESALHQSAKMFLTLILLPGAFFVFAILFCLFWLEIIIKKIWENLTFIFLMWTIFFCKKKFFKKRFFWVEKKVLGPFLAVKNIFLTEK